jgi:hypothetical protein
VASMMKSAPFYDLNPAATNHSPSRSDGISTRRGSSN